MLNFLLGCVLLILIGFFTVVSFRYYIMIINEIKTEKYRYVEKHDHYTKILKVKCKEAFDIVYDTKIIVWDSDGIKMDTENKNKFKKEYIKILQILLGKRSFDFYINFYGTQDDFVESVSIQFDLLYVNSELKKYFKNKFINLNKNENVTVPKKKKGNIKGRPIIDIAKGINN